MTSNTPTPYDVIAYPSRCHPQAHPDRLATMATLFGMAPAPVENCRVLELGCGEGVNLLALAHQLPGSLFEGVDLASSAIARADEDGRNLGLTNICFHCANLLDWTPPDGPFDYVIAHGIFSWVPKAVRLRILELCRQLLAPQGVAYISYNVLPGYQVRCMLRELLRLHTREVEEPTQKIRQAKDLLRLLQMNLLPNAPFAALLKEEADRILIRDADPFVFHDALAEVNQPLYFHEFAALAEQYDLQYLAEADFHEMAEAVRVVRIAEAFEALNGNIVLKEQYLDFVRWRRFRQSLLCHAELRLERSVRPSLIYQFLLASEAKLNPCNQDLSAGSIVTFTNPDGIKMQVDAPLTIAAMLELRAAWPRALPFNALLTAARQRLGVGTAGDLEVDARQLAECMLTAYAGAMIELHSYQPAWQVQPHTLPDLSPFVRWQLMHDRHIVATLRHTNTHVGEAVSRAMLLLLDGTRDVHEVAVELGRLLDARELHLPASILRENLHADVEKAMRDAAANAMLIAWDPSAIGLGRN